MGVESVEILEGHLGVRAVVAPRVRGGYAAGIYGG